jgi:hypothetical protein
MTEQVSQLDNIPCDEVHPNDGALVAPPDAVARMKMFREFAERTEEQSPYGEGTALDPPGEEEGPAESSSKSLAHGSGPSKPR